MVKETPCTGANNAAFAWRFMKSRFYYLFYLLAITFNTNSHTLRVEDILSFSSVV